MLTDTALKNLTHKHIRLDTRVPVGIRFCPTSVLRNTVQFRGRPAAVIGDGCRKAINLHGQSLPGIIRWEGAAIPNDPRARRPADVE